VKTSVEGYVTAVLELESVDGRNAVANELVAVRRLAESRPELEMALTDTAVPGAARRALLDDLLAGRISDPARRIAVFVAGALFAPEVLGGLDWAAHRAYRAAEGAPELLGYVGHLDARARVGGYATAVLEDVPTTGLDEIEDELFRFARIVESMSELRSMLSDRDVAPAARTALVDGLLGGKVQPATLRLIRYGIVGGRSRDLVGTLDYLVERVAEARGWRVARVHAARAVDEAQIRELSASISTLTGRPVELQVTIDPELLAGALIQVGDLQVDATARGRLDNLREHLLSTEWHSRGLDLTDESGRTNPDTSRGSN
jgi:F-type H+-transporting ATPase subunit delta